MRKYKVVYYYSRCEWVYGYADTLGEAIELNARCEDDGWACHQIVKWDETRGRWVRAN